MFDVLITRATIVDGTGTARYPADIAIQRDRIAQIGDLAGAAARQRQDAAGMIVAPGFIDVHNHSDGWFIKAPYLPCKLLQGFTSEVLMADGISYAPVRPETVQEWIFYLRGLDGLRPEDYRGWQSWADYMQRMHQRNAQNAAGHLPYANIRSLVAGFTVRELDDFQLRQVRYEVRRGMEQGAVGLSTGLDYIAQLHTSTAELVAACSAMLPEGGLYATHVRYKMGLLPALREAVEIGRRAGVPVHISHLKATTPQLTEEVFAFLDEAARDVDVSFDIYPYYPGSTLLNYLLPYEVWQGGPLAAMGMLTCPRIRRKFREGLEASGLNLSRIHIAWLPGRDHTELIGQTLQDFVQSVGGSAEDALCDLLIEERMAVLCVLDRGDDTVVDPFLQHPRGMIATDGIYFPESCVHPRVFGSVGRILGRCVRERGVLTLEQAVRKLSGFPAERFGLAQRGLIREGNFADLVVFDPNTVVDLATYESPLQPSQGISDVLVNGVRVVQHGELVCDGQRELPGRFLRREVVGG